MSERLCWKTSCQICFFIVITITIIIIHKRVEWTFQMRSWMTFRAFLLPTHSRKIGLKALNYISELSCDVKHANLFNKTPPRTHNTVINSLYACNFNNFINWDILRYFFFCSFISRLTILAINSVSHQQLLLQNFVVEHPQKQNFLITFSQFIS